MQSHLEGTSSSARRKARRITAPTNCTCHRLPAYWVTHNWILTVRKRLQICFWNVTQRRLVVSYRHFGTTYWPPSATVKQSKKCLTLEDGTDTLSRNVDNKVPICAALHPWRVKISFTPLRKPEVTLVDTPAAASFDINGSKAVLICHLLSLWRKRRLTRKSWCVLSPWPVANL